MHDLHLGGGIMSLSSITGAGGQDRDQAAVRKPAQDPPDMGRSLRCNWDAFWSAALKDHCHAGLIWNERTRSELREALQVD